MFEGNNIGGNYTRIKCYIGSEQCIDVAQFFVKNSKAFVTWT